jgi:hypothetical protein
MSRSGVFVPDPFHVFEENLLAAAVIEFRGPAVGVAGDSLAASRVPSFSRKFVIPVVRKE